MGFALWHRDSLNLQGFWKSAPAALAGVRQVLARSERDVSGYALARVDDRGEYHDVAGGQALVDLVNARPATPARRRRAA